MGGKGKVILTLEAKKEIGRRLIAGDLSVKTAQKEYNVSPQAVGWWKRLAEKEEMATQEEIVKAVNADTNRLRKGLQALGFGNPPEVIDDEEDVAPFEVDDNTMKIEVTGLIEVQIRDSYGKVILNLPGKDLVLRRDFKAGVTCASWKEDE